MEPEPDTLDKIAYILDQLERRVTALETGFADLNETVIQLNNVNAVHAESIGNLADRMSHESHAILDIIDDVKAMVGPAYDKAVPTFEQFNREVDAVLRPKGARGD